MIDIEQVWDFIDRHPDVVDPGGDVNAHFGAAVIQTDSLEQGYSLWKRDLAILDQAVQQPLDRAAESIARKLREQASKS